MPNIRALTDLHIKSIYVPLNRVANVDDDTAAELVELGQATDDPAHVEQALLHNPEVIELGGDKPKKKAKAKADPEKTSEGGTGGEEETGEADPGTDGDIGENNGELFPPEETAKAKKAKPAPEEQANSSND